LLRGRRLLAAALLLLTGAACGGQPAVLECHRRALVTESGLSIRDLDCGRGAPARRGDLVTVRYSGRLREGRTFDRSGARPFTFPLGRGQVIPGWDQGLVGMRPGGYRRLVIPPDLAYGSAGYLDLIPPGASLEFRVRLLEVRAVR
jgi:FKBP-type peptidyl-prolyl cis-trans isomerase